MATVKQMEERGEKLEEATPEEILEAASKAAETVFKFDFGISEGAEDAEDAETSNKKRNRNRKRNKKRRAQKPRDEEEKSEDSATTERSAVPVTPAQRGNAKDKQKKQEKLATKSTTGNKRTGSSFLKLRKATGTESEAAKMHLRYGQGRRNLTATKQREQRKKDKAEDAAASDDFKFNFAAS
ncbi:hypothetical protein V7S43_007367 [Phytophthora oleae]|uniref:Srp40 C-terminal domain-containing protein n=1 Tax=Phytophthora oleae TaxID=2107226 RepID=A0ABD3FND8_9STRA